MTLWSGVPRTLHPQRVSAQRTESLERHVEAAGTIWRAQRSQRRVGRVNQARSGMETGVWRLLESGRVGMGWDGMMRECHLFFLFACHAHAETGMCSRHVVAALLFCGKRESWLRMQASHGWRESTKHLAALVEQMVVRRGGAPGRVGLDSVCPRRSGAG